MSQPLWTPGQAHPAPAEEGTRPPSNMSTLPVSGAMNAISASRKEIPAVGVDPGSRWTGAVLRVGDVAVTGWTLGPVNRLGQRDRAALDNVDNWEAFRRYVDRLIAHLDDLVTYGETEYGPVRIAVEVPHTPIGWQAGNRGTNKLPLNDVFLPRQIASALIGCYPNAVLVPPGKYGQRADEVPAVLRGRRPADWGPNETPRGERDHEQSAYFVSGIAAAGMGS